MLDGVHHTGLADCQPPLAIDDPLSDPTEWGDPKWQLNLRSFDCERFRERPFPASIAARMVEKYSEDCPTALAAPPR
jgi:hypothetical protein